MGEPGGRGVLKPDTLKLMRQPHASQMAADIWGLGTILYAPNGAGDFIIGHDGKRRPAINTTVRLNPSTGDGIVVLQSGNQLLATTVAGEWVFWKTGTIDFLMFTLVARQMITIIFIGWGAIILTALLSVGEGVVRVEKETIGVVEVGAARNLDHHEREGRVRFRKRPPYSMAISRILSPNCSEDDHLSHPLARAARSRYARSRDATIPEDQTDRLPSLCSVLHRMGFFLPRGLLRAR